ASAQLGLIPRAGIYIPAGDFAEIDDAVEGTIDAEKEAAFALGATLEISKLYVSLDYVTGSQLSTDGLANGDDLGNGSMLAIAGGLVFRPAIPLIQPHIRLGAGVKRQNYSFDDQGFDIDFPDDDTDFALHGAVGLTLGIGGLGVQAELADYVTADGFSPNDLILSLGLRLGF